MGRRVYKEGWGKRPIGITLNSEWREPRNPKSQADADAKERDLQYQLGWFAEPVFLTGDYPALMRQELGERLPAFTPEESSALLGSSDFFGFNWYSARMIAKPTMMSNVASLPSLVRMAMAEPAGLRGFLKDAVGGLWPFGRKKDTNEQREEAEQTDGHHYFADIGVVPSFRGSWAVTDMCWPVVPWALARFLVYITDKYKPEGGIIITENGVAVPGEDDLSGASDTSQGAPGAKRVSFVRSHLVAIHKAIEAGADVRGYFLWSLLDNFEWAFGYAKRFGAFHVDYDTLKRTPKPVVELYSCVIAANAVVPSASEVSLDPFADSALDFRPDHW